MINIIESINKPKKDFYNHSYISIKNKFFFHSVGKAANSTVKHYLYSQELQGTGIKYKTVHDRLNSPLLSPYQLDNINFEKVFFSEEYFRFTFVRNPFSRILSCYLDRLKDKRSAPYKELIRWTKRNDGTDFSFSDFIEIICDQNDFEQNNHWRLQFADTMFNVVNYNFIGKQEYFAQDMRIVWSNIYPNINPPDFSKINKSPSKTSSADKIGVYWTSRLRDIFYIRYKKDFEIFGYSEELPL